MLDRLWDALYKTGASPETAMDIVNTEDCGLSQRSTRSYSHGTFHGPTIGSGSTPLMLAILADRPDVAAKFLAAGAKVDAKDYEDKTSLHEAVANHSTVCINVLSDYGADINVVDKIGATPLHVAVESQDLPCLKALLAEGADVRAAYPKLFRKHWVMFTPLHEAALLRVRDDDQIVAALIKNGADPNFAVAPTIIKGCPDRHRSESFTPLHIAAGNGCKIASTCLKQLIAAGANPNAKTELGVTPLHVAVQDTASDWYIHKLLASGANVNAVTKSGHTALHYAILRNSFGKAKLLISKGADVNAQLETGHTPLHLAVQSDNKKLVKLIGELLTSGANVNAVTKSGHTALHYVILRNSVIEYVNAQLQTPLHLAAQSDNKYLMKLLIDGGAYVEATDKDNLTPLCVAVLHNNIKNVVHLVKTLLAARADVNWKNKLDFAAQNGHAACLETLLACGAKMKTSISNKLGWLGHHCPLIDIILSLVLWGTLSALFSIALFSNQWTGWKQ